MKWRHIKRILFWPKNKLDAKYIFSKIKQRQDLYEKAIYVKDKLCKQTKLNEKFYRAFRKEETEHNEYSGDLKIKCLEHILLEYDLLSYLTVENNGFPLLYDISIAWKNAPFWKDYESWKKIQELNKDFKL